MAGRCRRHLCPWHDPRCATHDPSFDGWGRVPTDAQGRYRLSTIRPGPVAGPNGQPQAAHLVVLVFMRGLLRGVATRLYFADDPQLSGDPILALVPPERRGTLLARARSAGDYVWDIHMQRDAETVFFSY